jgi:tubulin polyglutamylase TTLL4
LVEDSKWSIPFFVKYCQDSGIDSDALFKEFERVTTATVIQSHHQRNVPHRHSAYDQLGIDLLVDQGFGVSILEVNVSPSMSGLDSKLDYEIKSRLMHDLLAMARIIDCNCDAKDPRPGIGLVDNECRCSVSRQRTVGVKSGKIKPWDDPVFADYQMIRDLVEESGRLNGYRRVYPKRKTIEQFWPCHSQISYHDIVQGEWIKLNKEDRKAVLIRNFRYSKKECKNSNCKQQNLSIVV